MFHRWLEVLHAELLFWKSPDPDSSIVGKLSECGLVGMHNSVLKLQGPINLVRCPILFLNVCWSKKRLASCCLAIITHLMKIPRKFLRWFGCLLQYLQSWNRDFSPLLSSRNEGILPMLQVALVVDLWWSYLHF